MSALCAAAAPTCSLADLPTAGAATGLCWGLWRTSASAEALEVLRRWMRSSAAVDGILLGHAAMHLEWQREELFLEYETLMLLDWASLEGTVCRWETWLQQQRLSRSELMSRSLLRGTSDLPSR